MRLFGAQFLGQAATFVYLNQATPGVSAALWPQYAIYNFLVANFWPLYWIGFAIDRAQTRHIYSRIFEIGHGRAHDILSIFHATISQVH